MVQAEPCQTYHRRSDQLGIILGVTIPDVAQTIAIFGALFVNALKRIAPIVFFLVASARFRSTKSQQTNSKSVIVLYLLGTFNVLVAVVASFIFSC